MERKIRLNNIVSEWTAGLGDVEARKKIFADVRDFKYEILSGHFNLKNVSEQVLNDQKGFCLSKHYLLGELLEELGYKVKYCTYSFKWASSGIHFPQELKALAEELPVTYHVACKVFIEDKWVLVDATWDKSLVKRGFKVNKWDGKNNTLLAVDPVEEFESSNIGNHHIFYRKKMKEYSLKDKVLLARFTKMFNAWISEARQV